jgi:hypothetical protein
MTEQIIVVLRSAWISIRVGKAVFPIFFCKLQFKYSKYFRSQIYSLILNHTFPHMDLKCNSVT